MVKNIQLFVQNGEVEPQTLGRRFRDLFLVKKLNTPTGLFVLLFCSLVIGALIAYKGMLAVAGILAITLGPTMIYAIVAYPRFGITVLLIMAYLLFYIMRFGIDFPLGTVMDGMQALLILGFFIHQRKKPNWNVFKGPVSGMIIIWIFYNLIEVANPVTESRLAWVYTIRAVAIVMLMYFVFMYQIQTIATIRNLLKMWLGLALFAALYAFKQEYIGFSDAEDTWLHSDPNIADLLFIAGHWRKFSIFSDPVAFSYNMVVASILSIVLLTLVRQVWKKIVLAILTALFFSSMLFSGTRGAYVLLPAAMLLFVILRLNRQVLIGSAIAGLFMHHAVFIYGEWHVRAPKIILAHGAILVGAFGTGTLTGNFNLLKCTLWFGAGYLFSLYGSIGMYRIFFHRLSRANFPGPLYARASKIPYVWACRNSKNHIYLETLRKKYGEFVRTGDISTSSSFISQLIDNSGLSEITCFHPDVFFALDWPRSDCVKTD